MTPDIDEKTGVRMYGYGYIRRPEDPTKCIENVHDYSTRWPHRPHQCARKRGHGPDGLYCKQHSPESVAERRKKEDAKWAIKKTEWDIESQNRKVANLARALFKQEATFDDLKREVVVLEALYQKLNT